jgi:hypothetical protein
MDIYDSIMMIVLYIIVHLLVVAGFLEDATEAKDVRAVRAGLVFVPRMYIYIRAKTNFVT